MSHALRIVADVDRVGGDGAAAGWSVRLTCPADREWSWPEDRAAPRLIRAGVHRGSLLPLPDPGWCPGGRTHELCCEATAEAVASAADAIANRSGRGDGAALGRLLFAALLGADGWRAVGKLVKERAGGAPGIPGIPETTVELALRWPAQDLDLVRLPWELLHDGQNYLATSNGTCPVAVTRVVRGSRGMSRPLRIPSRVLFAVGAPVTDGRVRPGAEMMGLLRAVRGKGNRVHHRVLYRASPARLRAAVEAFQPDVVHVIAHGGIDEHGRSYLELISDDPDDRLPQRLYAEQFAVYINSVQLTLADGAMAVGKPPVVVLSACKSGGLQVPRAAAAAAAAGRPQPGAPLGAGRGDALQVPKIAAPYAGQLVAAGVPVVVAMGGMVTDRACRVFTRQFGAAVVTGGPLVEATAEARRLAFGGEVRPDALDWALPEVFLADDPEPRPPEHDAAARTAANWVSDFELDLEPVFCGREEILSTFVGMFPGDGGARTGWDDHADHEERPSVLVVCAVEADDGADRSGVGKTRLLKEVAKQALLEGHLPVLISPGAGQEAPNSLADLCTAINGGIVYTRAKIGLLPGVEPQLGRLGSALGGYRDPPAELAWLLESGADELAVRAALAADVQRLAADARAEYPHLTPPGRDPGRVVLLFDDLNQASAEVMDALVTTVLQRFDRQAPAGEPVPAVMMVYGWTEAGMRRKLSECGFNDLGRRVRLMWLKPFDEVSGEDMLAYEQVLLHPFRQLTAADDVTARPWAFNRDPRLRESRRDKGLRLWRRHMKGLPVRFQYEAFELAILATEDEDEGFLIPATDEDRIRVAR